MMNIIKILNDYSKTPIEKELSDYLALKLDSTLCAEKITNKNFLLKYIQPQNNIFIYTNELPCPSVKKIL